MIHIQPPPIPPLHCHHDYYRYCYHYLVSIVVNDENNNNNDNDSFKIHDDIWSQKSNKDLVIEYNNE